MKGAFILTAAAGLLGSAVASQGHQGHRRHGHDLFHRRGAAAPEPVPEPAQTCGCTTRVVTEYGEATSMYKSSSQHSKHANISRAVVPEPKPEPTTESTTTISSTSYTTVTVSVTPSPSPSPSSSSSSSPPPPPSPEVELPTPVVTVFPTPGTYTIEPTTIVVTSETTVCAATSTDLSPGDHTYGGITTIVEEATTIVCPIATVKPDGDTVTSVIETTTFVCPSGGTYTIAPSTTSVSQSTVLVYPTPVEYPTGTYTQPGETVTVVETDFVYVCPPATTAPPVTETPPPPPPPPVTSKPAPAPAPSSAPPAPKPSSPVTLPVGGNDDKWGITFTPYAQDGECMSEDEVNKGIESVKNAGFDTVRVYAPDCDALETVGSACKAHGLKLIVGIFISSSGIDVARDQISETIAWGQWDMVDLIVVGNEAIFSSSADAASLAVFIKYAKDQFQGAGYDGPVTTTEPLNIWEEHHETLCAVVDVVGANIHPYFNDKVTATKAGDFVKGQIEILHELCGGKDVVNLETGWPSSGKPNGLAIAGPLEQTLAIKSILEAVGSKSVFFSYQDDLWKEPGPYGIEQSWGCIKAFV